MAGMRVGLREGGSVAKYAPTTSSLGCVRGWIWGEGQ